MDAFTIFIIILVILRLLIWGLKIYERRKCEVLHHYGFYKVMSGNYYNGKGLWVTEEKLNSLTKKQLIAFMNSYVVTTYNENSNI